MKRALTLMTVTVLGGAASADTTVAPVSVVAATPRTLASGAPACGNVMNKYMPETQICPVIRQLYELEVLGRNLDAELIKLAIEPPSLTVVPRARPSE